MKNTNGKKLKNFVAFNVPIAQFPLVVGTFNFAKIW